MSEFDKAKFESVETHTYTVRLVCKYEVVHSSSHSRPLSIGSSFGSVMATCNTREEADKLARFLCESKYHAC